MFTFTGTLHRWMARHQKDNTNHTHPLSLHTVDGTKGNTISSPLHPYMYMLCCRWHSFHHYHLLSFSSVFLSPFPFFFVHFTYSLFPFSFFRYGCSIISISRRKGFRSWKGIYATGPGCWPSIGVSSSCECKLTESKIPFTRTLIIASFIYWALTLILYCWHINIRSLFVN